jgi:hypothetical protein
LIGMPPDMGLKDCVTPYLANVTLSNYSAR